MTDPTPSPVAAGARQFAALVALLRERPTAALEQREAARALLEALRGGGVRFASVDGRLEVDGVPFDDALLAGRFAAYGLESLGLTPQAAQADLLDLARLLASEPGAGDASARFTARAAVLDPKALPRTMRPREGPSAAVPEPPSAPSPARPGTPSRAMPSVGAAPAPRASASDALPTPAAGTRPVGTPSAGSPAVGTPARGSRAVGTPAAGGVAVESASADFELGVLPRPTPSHHALATALEELDLADSTPRYNQALDALVLVADLAFRHGRDQDLVEALTALVAVEWNSLQGEGADERRQFFNHAIRRLARPVLLRRLAVLRHQAAGDAVTVDRVQQALRRFGQDGAEALIDEWASAPSAAAREACLAALRDHRRTYDALLGQVRDQRPSIVAQAAGLLGALRDARGEPMLGDLLQHPDAGVRRAAVTALARFESETALEALGAALADESPSVRARAVSALAARRQPRVLPLLGALVAREPEREVLFGAIAAIGQLGTPEAVQLLIAVAQGEGQHPQRRSAALRIQACTALVAIRTPVAMAAVQVLRDDRDREVREASVRLVAQASRRSTTGSMPAIRD